MGILSTRHSINHYRVSGKVPAPIHETVFEALKANIIPQVEDDATEMSVGWTSFDKPYAPDFEGYSFVLGDYMIFSLRIDKKNLPSKLVQKHYALELARRQAETGQTVLSRSAQKAIKDHVVSLLWMRIPATPNVYDLIWKHETTELWFFSNLKSANEELETLFFKSFNLHLIRLFPYTLAELNAGLTDAERDRLNNLSPTNFLE